MGRYDCGNDVAKLNASPEMPVLLTPKDFQEAKKLDFCYLCGESFDESNPATRDHVFARRIFDLSDREPSFILPGHGSCNNERSMQDETAKEFLGILRGKRPSRKTGLKFNVMANAAGGLALGVEGLPLRPLVTRWLRAFHAALYREPLPNDTQNAIHLPLRAGDEKDGVATFEKELPQQRPLVKAIKQNRVAGKLDRVHCNAGQVRFECVWIRTDYVGPLKLPRLYSAGQWICIFALDVHGWLRLTDADSPPMNCVGAYWPASGVPNLATRGTTLEFDVKNTSVLDPFGD